METKELKSWNCLPGDVVMFVLKHGTPFTPGRFFWGKVVARPTKKTATIKSGHFKRVSGKDHATVHVSCLKITKPVKRFTKAEREEKKKEGLKQAFARHNFSVKPGQQKQRPKKKDKKVRQVCGMKFVY
jgi:hypothetical protein